MIRPLVVKKMSYIVEVKIVLSCYCLKGKDICKCFSLANSNKEKKGGIHPAQTADV